MTEEIPPKVNYPANTNKEKVVGKPQSEPKVVQKKVVTKVITGEATHRKKTLGRKIAETFAGGDMKSVGNYILFDVVIPAAKAMLSDAASQGVERMLFGSVRRPGSGSSISAGVRSLKTNYNKMYYEPNSRREISQKARATHDFREVILDTRGDAEEVLERLIDLVDNYDVATVSDLYELVGLTGNFTDDKYGWTDLRDAQVVRVRQGYMLNLPQTTALD